MSIFNSLLMGCVCAKETVTVDNRKFYVRSRLAEGYITDFWLTSTMKKRHYPTLAPTGGYKWSIVLAVDRDIFFLFKWFNINAATLLNLYKSLVRPHLDYCSVVWNPHYLKDINIPVSVGKLLRVYPRAASKLVTWPTRHTVKSSHCISQLVTRSTWHTVNSSQTL